MAQVYNDAQLSSFVDQIFTRLRAIEDQLRRVSDAAGVPWVTAADGAPPEVLELARAGKRLDAIRRYRELTGADLETAKGVVEAL
ncbi:MAG: hypothetical protein U0237_12560 [Thermoleophilia bacterium]